MKGELISLEKVFDNATCEYFFVAVINFNDKPNLKLGNCEVKQYGEKT